MRHTLFDDVALLGLGHHLPERVVTTESLGLDRSFVDLTGVRTRHVAPASHATSDLVIRACERALDGYEGPPIDRVLVATVTPDHPSPATAPLVQHGLGLPTVPAIDLGGACAGFVLGLDLAARCVLTGDRAVLVGAGECRVRTLRAAAPGVRVLFGDGAGAAIVGPAAGAPPGSLRLLASVTGADGRGHGAVIVPAGGSRLPTSEQTLRAGQHALQIREGPHVFFEAVEGLVDVARALLEPLGLCAEDLDLIVPHQANLRILERVARILRAPRERFAIEVDQIGNVGGASAAIVLDRALRRRPLPAGSSVMVLTAGAGYTAGAALLEVT
ncbi:MAG: ketoacyl-ACP synthase III [Deltaproteobacteria bacterium]|nr:MAG: ketoacyl-ACP synthase III [Deltaproteobacteria bacterium]